jgi:hypothetical protein
MCLVMNCYLTGCAHNNFDRAKTKALYEAARNGDTASVETLIAQGASPTSNIPATASYRGYVQSRASESAIHGAARARNIGALRAMLARAPVLPSTNGDAEWLLGGFKYTPLDGSVMEIEAPGPVTDLLIEAGYRPRVVANWKNVFDVLYIAGSHWALASYQERHGDAAAAARNYDMAAEMYANFSQTLYKLAKRQEFARSPLVSLFANTVASGASVVAFRTGNYGTWFNIEYQRARAMKPDGGPTATASFPTDAVYEFAPPAAWSAEGKEIPVVLKSGQSPPSLEELAQAPKDQPLSNFRDYALHTALLCRYCADRARTLRKE